MKFRRFLFLRRVLMFLIFLEVVVSFCIVFYRPDIFDENRDYVFYSRAVSLAVIDVDEALGLCSESGQMRGECFTNIAKVVSKKDSNQGLDICEMINNAGWRSECFFVISEILFDKNVSLAFETCKKSEMFQNPCYINLGLFSIFSISSFYNVSSVISVCGEVPVKFKSSCFVGLGQGIGRRFGGDVSFAISVCGEVPVEFKDECFVGLGLYIGLRFGGDISHGVLACEKFPVEFRESCLNEII